MIRRYRKPQILLSSEPSARPTSKERGWEGGRNEKVGGEKGYEGKEGEREGGEGKCPHLFNRTDPHFQKPGTATVTDGWPG